MAKALGYTEAHISRTFHRYLGIGIPEYLNGLRLEYIAKQLENGSDQTIENLIYKAFSGYINTQKFFIRNKATRQKAVSLLLLIP